MVNNQQKEKPLESLLSHLRGETKRGPPRWHKTSKQYKSKPGYNVSQLYLNLFNPSIYYFSFDQSIYIESCKAKH